MPCSAENIVCPPTTISPARGRSSPAIERNVVVLPQPLGPSSVKSRPSGTSNVTSRTARTTSPSSFGYSVQRPRTVSTTGRSKILDAELPSRPLRQRDEDEQRQDEQHTEGGELDVLAVLPELPDHDRHHFSPGAVEEDRA